MSQKIERRIPRDTAESISALSRIDELMFATQLSPAMVVVADSTEKVPGPEIQDARRRCRACAASPFLTRSFLDSVSGKTIRLFECRCGERIWDD